MKHVKFDYINIDDERIEIACDAYFGWKKLNDQISNLSHRGINMPDAISEPMGCWCLDLLWNRGSAVGDASDPSTGMKYEFKATSRFEGDLSSFGPECDFDDLVFLRFDTDNDLLLLYDLQMNAEQFGYVHVNKTERVKDQQAQKRRPRLSLYENLIKPNGFIPDLVFDIRRIRIIEDNREKNGKKFWFID